jgi:threonine/homoserine/homoserine lactone efflux protein
MIPTDPIQMFILAFAIGLTGALTPGPTLVATIQASLTHGWSAGPKVTLGHMVAELAIFLLIACGLAAAAVSYSGYVAGVGGIALILFGLTTLWGSREAENPSPGMAGETANPYLAGLVMSAANPFFWIWWLTVGSAMVIAGLQAGFLIALLFLVGHWCADLGWLTTVSAGIGRGRAFLSVRVYRGIMAACGIFLAIFGLYFLAGVLFA